MKKMLLILMAILLLLTACALAEETEEPVVYYSGDWMYVLLEDGMAEIAGYEGWDQNLTIPAELDGYEVTSIGDSAFEDYWRLTSITLPNNVTSIDANPFAGCYNLTDIIVSLDHPTLEVIDGVLFDKTEKRLICYSWAYMVGSYDVPQGTCSIADDAFNNCGFLTNVTLPEGLTSIGDSAFSSCKALTSITLPDSVSSIGDSAFYSCDSLTSITLPDSVTSIGANPFVDCDNLTDIVVSPEHPTLEVVDGVLFDKVEKRLICYPYAYTASSYTVPQGILGIGDEAFFWCESLTSITLPDGLTTIGDEAFNYVSLTSITLPGSVTSIGDGAFSGCYSLTLTIPQNTWLTDWCEENAIPYTYAN